MSDHYTAEEIVKSPFLFVSYSHKDEELVHCAVDHLIQEGIHLWYDADLKNGDKWDNATDSLIRHENCKGVIFFNSASAYVSDAVAKERKSGLDKYKQWAAKDKKFHLFVANIGKPTTMQILRQVLCSLPDDGTLLQNALDTERLQVILELFPDSRICGYIEPESPMTGLQKLGSDIRDGAPEVVNLNSAFMRQFQGSGDVTVVGKAVSVSIGTWRGEPVEDLPTFLLSKDGTMSYHGSTYMVLGGKGYLPAPMEWLILHAENDIVTLVAKSCVDIRAGGAELQRWLKEEFLPMAFSEQEQSMIAGRIGLLTAEDIRKAEDTDFLKTNLNPEKYWWLNEMASGALQKVVREDGSIYNTGYNSRTKKCGVRPVIRLQRADLTALIN